MSISQDILNKSINEAFDNENKVPTMNQVFIAIKQGNFQLFKDIISKIEIRKYNSYQIIDTAAFYGRLDIIKWSYVHVSQTFSLQAVSWAFDRGHREVLHWLYENRWESYPGDEVPSVYSVDDDE